VASQSLFKTHIRISSRGCVPRWVQGILFPGDAVVMQMHAAAAQDDLQRVVEGSKRHVDANEESASIIGLVPCWATRMR
jgi:hypothetical protein